MFLRTPVRDRELGFMRMRSIVFAALFAGGYWSTRKMDKDWRYALGGALLGGALSFINRNHLLVHAHSIDKSLQGIELGY